MRVVDLIADAVAQAGVRHIFTVMGDGNLELLEALERRDVELVHARHEQGAVAMADGYARASGGLGVASVTGGTRGVTQTATSLATARARGSRVLLLAGDDPVSVADRTADFDQLAFARLVAGAAWTVWSARGAAGTLQRVAERLQTGPALLSHPADVQLEEIVDRVAPQLDLRPCITQAGLAETAAVNAVAALEAARRPMILAGRGAVDAGAGPALMLLADRLGAPLATTLIANGLCTSSPWHVGVSGGLGDGRGTRALHDADCVYVAGASLSRWTRGGKPVVGQVVRIDSDARSFLGSASRQDELGDDQRSGDIDVVGDVRAATERILEGLGERGARTSAAKVPAAPRPLPADYDDGPSSVDPRRALSALDAALPRERRIILDGGHFAIFATQLLTVNAPEQFLFAVDAGAIGQGLAVAIGATFARPDPRSTLVVGDGGFLMAAAELESAARYRVPLTMFVLNDEGFGQERHNMRARGMDDSQSHIPSPDLVAMAQAVGARGLSVRSPAELEQLGPALAEAEGPLLVDVRINGEVRNAQFESITEVEALG